MSYKLGFFILPEREQRKLFLLTKPLCWLKNTKSLFLIATFTLLLSSCNSHSPPKNELRLNLQSEPLTLHPGKVRNLHEVTLTTALFEGLTRTNAIGEPELALASDVTISEDGLTYTFHLKSAHWTNQTPVTASDFVTAWQRALDPNFPCDLAYLFYDIQHAQEIKKGEKPLSELGAKALNAHCLEVTLARRNPHFLEIVARPPFLPVCQNLAHPSSWATESDSFVSNGPFRLQTWDHHNLITLEKNPDYWDHSSVSLNKVHFYMVNDESTELQMFERGEIDWVGSPLSTISLSAIETLKQKNLLHVKPLCGTSFIRVNTQMPPFDQANIRRSLSSTIKRKEILEAVTYGTQMPALCLSAPPFNLLKEIPTQPESLEELPNITLTYMMGERTHLIAQAIQQDWREAFGIQIRLEGVESKVYFTRLRQKDYELILGSLVADYLDPLNLLQVLEYPKLSDSHWNDPQYCDLLNHARDAKTHSERSEWLSQAENRLLSEMPIIPLFHYNMLYLKQKRVKNVTLSPLGILDFKTTQLVDR